jgi:DNA-binding transcriptional LysR family regulator
MDNQNLSAFIIVAENKSFSEAAYVLDVTQSTISKRIALLESQVGKKLFDRIARRVALTEAGQELLPRARRILKEYANALQAINDLSGNVSGILRLAISHHLGLHRLPDLLKIFSKTYPDVVLDIEFMDSEKAYERVMQAKSEIGIITLGSEIHPNIHKKEIWE